MNKPKKNGLTRRQFFRNAGLAAGSFNLISSLPVSALAYVAGSEILKIGVIGCGYRVRVGEPDRNLWKEYENFRPQSEHQQVAENNSIKCLFA